MNPKISDASASGPRAEKLSHWLKATPGWSLSSEPAALVGSGVLVRYGLAILAVVAAVLLTYRISPHDQQPSTTLFFVAVILTSWYAGELPGILATLLSILALECLFWRPETPFHVQLLDTSLDLLAFAVGTWLINSLQNRWRRTHGALVTVRSELEIARRIQQQFFPSHVPTMAGLELSGVCFPAADTGGDFFDYVSMPNGSLALALGDVSGHGVGPALVMALVRAYLRALALTRTDPGAILTEANRLLYQDTADDCFATVFLAHVDPQTYTVSYASAGQEAFLLKPSGKITTLRSTGVPLAVQSDARIPCGDSISLGPGDILVLLSDGIAETRSSDNRLFGWSTALDIIQTHHHRSAEEIVTALHRAVCDFRGDSPQEDDMTILVAKAFAPATDNTSQ